MIGSILVIEAENIDKAREFIKSDVYVSKDVWKSWEIHPYRGVIIDYYITIHQKNILTVITYFILLLQIGFGY